MASTWPSYAIKNNRRSSDEIPEIPGKRIDPECSGIDRVGFPRRSEKWRRIQNAADGAADRLRQKNRSHRILRLLLPALLRLRADAGSVGQETGRQHRLQARPRAV